MVKTFDSLTGVTPQISTVLGTDEQTGPERIRTHAKSSTNPSPKHCGFAHARVGGSRDSKSLFCT